MYTYLVGISKQMNVILLFLLSLHIYNFKLYYIYYKSIGNNYINIPSNKKVEKKMINIF